MARNTWNIATRQEGISNGTLPSSLVQQSVIAYRTVRDRIFTGEIRSTGRLRVHYKDLEIITFSSIHALLPTTNPNKFP
jgi:hypothetical protein